MPPPIGLSLAGDGRLFRLTAPSARALVRWNRAREPRWRSATARAGEDRRWPTLAFLSRTELRRVAGVASSQVISGAWRLSPDDGRLGRGTTLDGGSRRADYVPLVGAIFVVEPLRPELVYAGGPRDLLVQLADRSTFRLVRFEGVAASRDGAGLVLKLRDRLRMDRRWAAPLSDPSDQACLRWYAILRALPQEGFVFTESPSLLGAGRASRCLAENPRRAGSSRAGRGG